MPEDANQMSDGSKQLTFGGRAVRLTFNPGNDPLVQGIKEQFAAVIDGLHNQRGAPLNEGEENNVERNRLLSIAITEAENACLWAVKAVTTGK